MLAELDLDVVLERVLQAAQELTEARYAALGVLNDERTELARFLTRGIDESARGAIGELPRGRGVLGALIDDPKPLRLADVSEHPRSYGFPHGHPPMRTFLGVPILVDGEPYGNLYLTEKAGRSRSPRTTSTRVILLADFAGVAIDHARRYTGTRRDHDELAQTVAALEATTQIARAVGGETDPEVVLQLVAKRGRALVSARTLLIELRRGDELEVAAEAGELPAELIGRRVSLENTVAAHAMRTNTVQRLEDDLNRARFDEHGLGRLGVDARPAWSCRWCFGVRRTACWSRSTASRTDHAFSAEDERLLESFAVERRDRGRDRRSR